MRFVDEVLAVMISACSPGSLILSSFTTIVEDATDVTTLVTPLTLVVGVDDGTACACAGTRDADGNSDAINWRISASSRRD